MSSEPQSYPYPKLQVLYARATIPGVRVQCGYDIGIPTRNSCGFCKLPYRTRNFCESCETCMPALGNCVRAVLIEQLFFPDFSSFFFPTKTGTAEKTGNISKVWKFKRGQIHLERLRSIPIFGGQKTETMEIQEKNCAKKRCKFRQKVLP